MLSRVADSLYWTSRYLERAENTARLIGVHINLELEQPRDASFGRWARVLGSLGLDKETARDLDSASLRSELCYDLANRASVVASIRLARDNARQVREQISSEMWEQLNRLYHQVQVSSEHDPASDDPVAFLDTIKEGAHLFQGVTDSTMNHGEGWHFIQLGRFIERAACIASFVDVHFEHYASDEAALRPGAGADAADYLEWIGLLKSATAFEAYCKVYTASIETGRVAEFLILDGTFPHSIRFSADMVHSALSAISDASPSRRSTSVMRRSGRLQALLGFSQVDEIIEGGIHHMLEDVGRQLAQIHSGIYQAFLSYPIETAIEA
ncbi:MAG: alpha-E domain-containing protein [Acidobacteria bacterium]|nr:alpha-E domain-containing protein [Acidobacteriota bacterium]